MNKGQFTIPNILGILVIVVAMFAMRGAIFDALTSAFNSSDKVLNQIPFAVFPVFFVVVLIMLVFYEEEPVR